MTCPTGGAPNINYGEKIIMEKPVNLPEPPDFTGKINYGNNGHLQELWEKRFGSLPAYFEPLWGKSNYGKIGRRRRLSKLNVFFSIILSIAIDGKQGRCQGFFLILGDLSEIF